MVTKLQKWGNSQGIRIPKQILMETYISEGDSVDVKVSGDTIVIRRMNSNIKRYSLEELLQGDIENQAEEGWGNPVGKEKW